MGDGMTRDILPRFMVCGFVDQELLALLSPAKHHGALTRLHDDLLSRASASGVCMPKAHILVRMHVPLDAPLALCSCVWVEL